MENNKNQCESKNIFWNFDYFFGFKKKNGLLVIVPRWQTCKFLV